MKVLALTVLALVAQPLVADNIYQTTAQGNEIVLQRDAIVVHQDSSLIDYKHFDLKERRVISVRLNRGSLPLRVQTVSDSARAKIVDLWKRLGYKADITDQAGKTSSSTMSISISIRREATAPCLSRLLPSPPSRFRPTMAARMKLNSIRSTTLTFRATISVLFYASKRPFPENSCCPPHSPRKSASWALPTNTTPRATRSTISPYHFPS